MKSERTTLTLMNRQNFPCDENRRFLTGEITIKRSNLDDFDDIGTIC
jgi:hypothetical protein